MLWRHHLIQYPVTQRNGQAAFLGDWQENGRLRWCPAAGGSSPKQGFQAAEITGHGILRLVKEFQSIFGLERAAHENVPAQFTSSADGAVALGRNKQILTATCLLGAIHAASAKRRSWEGSVPSSG